MGVILNNEHILHKVFGEKLETEYYDRPGAYIIPYKDGKFGVVRILRGLYFLGGGIEDSESDENCLTRECLEEIGYDIKIGKRLCSAETYCYHSKLGPFHPIQTYYLGELGEKRAEPTEKSHTLLWLTYQELKGILFSDMQNWALDIAWNELSKEEY